MKYLIYMVMILFITTSCSNKSAFYHLSGIGYKIIDDTVNYTEDDYKNNCVQAKDKFIYYEYEEKYTDILYTLSGVVTDKYEYENNVTFIEIYSNGNIWYIDNYDNSNIGDYITVWGEYMQNIDGGMFMNMKYYEID